MSTVLSTTEVRFTRTKAGVLRIGDTRVSLDSVIHAFLQGASAEDIASDFDTLTLGDVYAVISYYLHNRDEVEQYLSERALENAELRATAENRFAHVGLRDKLLARQRSQIR